MLHSPRAPALSHLKRRPLLSADRPPHQTRTPDPRAAWDPKRPRAKPGPDSYRDPRPAGLLGPQTPKRKPPNGGPPGRWTHRAPGTPDSRAQTPRPADRSGPQTPGHRPPTSSPKGRHHRLTGPASPPQGPRTANGRRLAPQPTLEAAGTDRPHLRRAHSRK